MKHNLKTLTLSLLVCCPLGACLLGAIAAVPSAVSADEPGASAAAAGQDAPAAGAAAAPQPAIRAVDLLEESRQRIDQASSLSCDLHELVTISAMKFAAVGRYVQASGNRLRLEFRIFPTAPFRTEDRQRLQLDVADGDAGDGDAAAAEQADKDKAVRGRLTIVSDGNVMYTYWNNGGQERVTRRTVSEIVHAAEQVPSTDGSRVLQDLGVGGLRNLLAGLQANMEFAKVRQEELGGRQLLIVTGRWNKQTREEVFGLSEGQEFSPDPLIPDYVRIYIDAEQRLPRRIQYLKGGALNNMRIAQPLVTLDFRRIVLDAEVDENLFRYEVPEGVAEEDITSETIEMIRRTAAPENAGGEKSGESNSDTPAGDASGTAAGGTAAPGNAVPQ